MGKILYPVGTEVQLRNWFLEENWRNGWVPGKRTVVRYEKGAKKPYFLSTSIGIETDRGFSVDEIKRYRQPVDDEVQHKAVDSHPQETAKTPVKSISTDEVEKIVREYVDEAVAVMTMEMSLQLQRLHDHLLEDADIIAKSNRLGEDE